jgi:FSR family fosmidomycin resistance protein-like MFS transporter
MLEHHVTDTTAPLSRPHLGTTTSAIIAAVSFCHMLNDVLQSMLSAIYPMLKEDFGLDFWQIGLLTFTFQVTASLLQPLFGLVIDKRPMPYSLPFGMGSSLVGLLLLAVANSYPMLLLGAALIGIGSAVFHPEASRVARMAAGGRYGMAQSFFQVGGNFGQAIGPLLAAFIVVVRGQSSVAWFALAALVGIFVLWRVGRWYEHQRRAAVARGAVSATMPLGRNRTAFILVILMLLTFTKNIYTAAIASYYTFYTMERFGLSIQSAQIMLFLFLGAIAVGTAIGGPIGDRIGPKAVIWFSILGALPFTLAMPYVGLFWTGVLSVIVGLIIASAFPAIVVMAQELVPGRVGMVAGIFFGFAFGMGGIAAAVLGIVADARGIEYVYWLCSFLPLMGLLAVFLPNLHKA